MAKKKERAKDRDRLWKYGQVLVCGGDFHLRATRPWTQSEITLPVDMLRLNYVRWNLWRSIRENVELLQLSADDVVLLTVADCVGPVTLLVQFGALINPTASIQVDSKSRNLYFIVG